MNALFQQPRYQSRKPTGRKRAFNRYRPLLETLEDRLAPATFTVLNTDDSGTGSLRQAILDANALAGLDSIVFNIADDDARHFYYRDDGVAGQVSAANIAVTTTGDASQIADIDPDHAHTWFSIQVATALPTIPTGNPILLNGYTQTGASANTNPVGQGLNTVLKIELTGGPSSGLNLSPGGNTVRGLAINLFSGRGIITGGAGGATLGNHLIEGNFIGTDVSGTRAAANAQDGIALFGHSDSTIGGTTPAARNLISGNANNGIWVSNSDHLIQGNLIGLDRTGTRALANAQRGIWINQGDNNQVGGADADARNVISGNTVRGIEVFGGNSFENVIQGNYVGADVTGTVAIPNGGANGHGILIHGGADDNLIGGSVPGAGNLISGNTNSVGLAIDGSGTTGNIAQGNFIGTQADGVSPLPNGRDGVVIAGSASDNLIGGTEPGQGNTIAFNGDGVVIGLTSVGNAILGNSIHSNDGFRAGLGIDLLGLTGPDANDPLDADTGGNNLQNYPVLTEVIPSPGSVAIQGSLNSTAETQFRIEFFGNNQADPSGHGEGETFLGFTNVTTDIDGNADFNVALAAVIPQTRFLTATATRLEGVDQTPTDTSEFSEAFQVAIRWNGDGDGVTWHDTANWVGNALPGADDHALISDAFAGITITSAANVGINNVTSAAGLTISGGTFIIAADSEITNTLTLSGGTLDFSTLTITGDYTQGAGGTLLIEIGGLTAGTQFDQLIVTGTAALAGTLTVQLIDDFVPEIGSTFLVLAGTTTGAFDTVNLPTLPPGREWQVQTGSVTLQVVESESDTTPTAMITVFPAAVAQDGAANLEYTFTRDTADGDLIILFSVSGTADFTSDYTVSSSAVFTFTATDGSITIPDGSPTATLIVDPLSDTIVEPDKTVIITITSDDPYLVGDPDTATGTIISTVVPPTPVQLMAVGADAGTSPRVQVYDANTGDLVADFLAYGAAFTGGVHVAVGDVNGDLVPDIITGAGPGGGSHVKVFDGQTFAEIRSFMAYGSGFTGGVFVAAGDINYDGHADIITGAGPGGGPHVKVFDGATNVELRSFFAFGTAFTGGVRVAAGDINGDFQTDIITAAGPGGGPHIKVFDGQTTSVLASFFAYEAAFTGGVFVATGDFNGDSRSDIITGAGAGGGPHVIVFDGDDVNNKLASFFAYPADMSGGVRVTSYHVNADARADLVVGRGELSEVKRFDSATLNEIDSFFAFPAEVGAFVG